jgi:hypothetical protein
LPHSEPAGVIPRKKTPKRQETKAPVPAASGTAATKRKRLEEIKEKLMPSGDTATMRSPSGDASRSNSSKKRRIGVEKPTEIEKEEKARSRHTKAFEKAHVPFLDSLESKPPAVRRTFSDKPAAKRKRNDSEDADGKAVSNKKPKRSPASDKTVVDDATNAIKTERKTPARKRPAIENDKKIEKVKKIDRDAAYVPSVYVSPPPPLPTKRDALSEEYKRIDEEMDAFRAILEKTRTAWKRTASYAYETSYEEALANREREARNEYELRETRAELEFEAAKKGKALSEKKMKKIEWKCYAGYFRFLTDDILKLIVDEGFSAFVEPGAHAKDPKETPIIYRAAQWGFVDFTNFCCTCKYLFPLLQLWLWEPLRLDIFYGTVVTETEPFPELTSDFPNGQMPVRTISKARCRRVVEPGLPEGKINKAYLNKATEELNAMYLLENRQKRAGPFDVNNYLRRYKGGEAYSNCKDKRFCLAYPSIKKGFFVKKGYKKRIGGTTLAGVAYCTWCRTLEKHCRSPAHHLGTKDKYFSVEPWLKTPFTFDEAKAIRSGKTIGSNGKPIDMTERRGPYYMHVFHVEKAPGMLSRLRKEKRELANSKNDANKHAERPSDENEPCSHEESWIPQLHESTFRSALPYSDVPIGSGFTVACAGNMECFRPPQYILYRRPDSSESVSVYLRFRFERYEKLRKFVESERKKGDALSEFAKMKLKKVISHLKHRDYLDNLPLEEGDHSWVIEHASLREDYASDGKGGNWIDSECSDDEEEEEEEEEKGREEKNIDSEEEFGTEIEETNGRT